MRTIGFAWMVALLIVGAMPFLSQGECAIGRDGLPGQDSKPGSYFPIALKNQWVYVMSEGSDGPREELVQIFGSDLVNGKEVFLTSNYSFGFVAEPIEFLTDDAGQTCEHQSGKFAVWYPWGDKVPVTLPYFGVDDCMRGARGMMYLMDEITVPAGTFRDVFRVVYDQVPCSDAGLVSETFARGVGLVERQLITFMGVQTWQLLSAQLQFPEFGSAAPELPATATTWGAIKGTFAD